MTTTRTAAPPAPGQSSLAGRAPHARFSALLALLLGVGVVSVLSLMLGSRTIAPGTVLDVLFHPDHTEAATIVHGLRLPRTVLALTVGAALGMAGALMQGFTRNPLADPGLLGVSFGASFAVVLGIFAFGVTSVSGYAWFALAGAGLAAVAVFAIGSTQGGPSPVTLVLAGAAVSALLGSLTQAIVLHDTQTLDRYRFWAVGSVAGRDLAVLWQVLPFLIGGVLLAAISAPGLNLLQLGEDVAHALGMRTLQHRMTGIGAVMLLTGAATAACGSIGFVGLVVPHAVRRLVGTDYRWVVACSGLAGASLVTAADILGRLLVRPAELQVGIVMALIGGPVFVLLVRRARMVSL